jgi:opacity protein-like surface antigen
MFNHWSVKYQLLFVLAVLAVLLAFSSTQAMAESYVAGMVGITHELPGNVNIAGSGDAREDAHYSNSVMYGGKVGHYFDSTPWLGIEAEVFNTTPNSKQQDFTIPGQGTVTAAGITQRVTTVALNAMLRMPNETIQPYVGIGPALMIGHINNTNNGGQGENHTTVGLNALGGVRYLVTKQIVVFVEAKYNYGKFDYGNNGVTVTYNAIHGAAGVGFQF